MSADTSSDDYTYSDGPTITLLNNGTATPTQSPAGETKLVTITGTNFGTNAAPLITTVKFGNSSATFSVTNSTQIIAATPTNVPAGIVDVTVTGPGGTSPTSAATKYEFTGAGGPLPTVTALAPNTAPINTTPQVVITGTNFVAPLTVSFGGVAATAIVVNSATQITVTAPSRANAGVVDVVVTTNAGASSATGTGNDFTYTGAGGTVTYQLFFRWTLIVWTGKTNVDALTLLRGLENPDNALTNDVSAQVTAIYRWSPNGSGCRDGAAQCWLGFFPSGVGVPGANDFSTLDNGQAYWFAIAGPGNTNWTTLTGP